MDDLGAVGRGGIQLSELFKAVCGTAALLLKLPNPTFPRVLSQLDFAGRKLDDFLTVRIAELPNQQQTVLLVHRRDTHTTVVDYQLPHRFLSIFQTDPVFADFNDATLIERLGLELCFIMCHTRSSV